MNSKSCFGDGLTEILLTSSMHASSSVVPAYTSNFLPLKMKGGQKFTDRRFCNLAAKSMARGLCLRSMFKRSTEEDESEGKIHSHTMYAVRRGGNPKADN